MQILPCQPSNSKSEVQVASYGKKVNGPLGIRDFWGEGGKSREGGGCNTIKLVAHFVDTVTGLRFIDNLLLRD